MRLEDRFLAALANHRDEPAIVEPNRSWSFAEVDALARHWAGQLRSQDGSRPAAVAVLSGRSATGYIGALAALYADSIFVPINPMFPAVRNASMMTATGVGMLIADVTASRELVAAILAVHPVPVLWVDLSAQVPVSAAELDQRRSEIAYVLFTSGSSGTPKGVPISHANVDSFLNAALARYPMSPPDRSAQTCDLTFDLSLASLFLAWAQGCAIVPASIFAMADPAKFVARYGITTWVSVPSAIGLANDAGRLDPGCLPGLRISIFCGEALTVDAAVAWSRAAPNSAVINNYGPTELTMFCTAFTFRSDYPVDGPTVPIGHSFEGVEVAVVDTAGRPADTGELLLRGGQMFGGYLDPSHNEMAFTDAEAPGGRWYRTGDLVRSGVDGLTYLGRLDDQLQVGGFRVEPAEVEQMIRTSLGVSTAVAVQRRNMIVAFVSPAPAQSARDPLLLLGDVLPAYMCPKHLVVVDEPRLNASGKIDRGYYKKRATELVA
ncbi:AMP-binding protein [Rhodococcus sp. AQ5-07]|uniref:AMP-binding protein n=1 Tax=Rhodococcus sp. AQ5-07 TaxID=2054902 RepID=UPI000DC00C55|nr:AMP-binding protein [Rhodococcus sp. AQ5-07]RAL30923.1 D-alanine--poly(phosphoribitol) ligase [Rhodococcus sp. AQ5-07]